MRKLAILLKGMKSLQNYRLLNISTQNNIREISALITRRDHSLVNYYIIANNSIVCFFIECNIETF
jgi:Pseudouridylate synthase